VARELARRGARIIAADEIGHQALRHDEVKAELVRRWGPGICDEQGAIDRRQVAALVFADPDERRALEAVVFPDIERGMDEQIALARQDPSVRFIVLDAAILLETGWDRRCDWIVYVHGPRRQRLERLTQKRGWSEKEVRQRSRAQMSLSDKATRAHFVVDNSGPVPELAHQIDRLLARPELADCNPSTPSD
jgi:dephospho-CoA kinase